MSLLFKFESISNNHSVHFMPGVSCSNNTEKNQMREKTNSISTIRALSHLEEKNFQSQIEGENTDLYWIYNDSMAVAITNYGGRIVGLWVPDQNGDWTDVVVGMGSVEDYINSTEAYFGDRKSVV